MTTANEQYNPQAIEQAQQAKWAEDKRYQVGNEKTDKPTKHILSMLPYPSGKLHMGHVRNYTIGDVLSRYYRQKGYEVMQPMGWDAFGLPAENAAIANGVAPYQWTLDNIDYMKNQLNSLGFSIDWSREFATCMPEYYKWEQWLFIQLFKKGMVYKKLSTVNWDPVDNCVLANEQVVDGRGWRSGAVVEKRDIPMYYYKITDYADELLEDLKQLEGNWSPEVITMQRNWIGRSQGMELHFPYQLDGKDYTLDVFTTRPDTLMGVTYVAVAAEHPIAQHAAQTNPDIAQFCEECKKGSTAEKDVATAEKKGMDTGLTVTHPISGEQVPVWVANYVLMSYGSGAVMAVPAHDERDFEFANKFGLPIKQVIDFADIDEAYSTTEWQDWYGNKQGGKCINSGQEFNGLNFDDTITAILAQLEPQGLAKATTNYRLRDWGVSRQRYWGCPIPTINCEHCGTQPVDEADLPVVLPTNVVPDGRSNPLEQVEEFVNTTCPKCGSPAKRETDTFDTFMESSWYYARYASPNYSEGMLEKSAVDKWLPVSQYIGGVEHAVMHLLYARYFHKIMRDEGLVSSDEPFAKLLTQGMVNSRAYYRKDEDGSTQYFFAHDLDIEYDSNNMPVSATLKADGKPVTVGKVVKMSKSKNNGVDPQETVDKYGADTVRLYTMFTAPADQTLEWSDDGLKGPYNFIKKVWKLASDHQATLQQSGITPDLSKLNQDALDSNGKKLRRKTHETIGTIDACLGEQLPTKLNTPVSSLMELSNELSGYKVNVDDEQSLEQSVLVQHEAITTLLTLLAIYSPHVAEYALENLGYDSANLSYPQVDEKALVQDSITMVVQVNGKVRGKMEVAPNTDAETIKAQAKAIDTVAKFLTGEIKKEIIVPNKLVNIVVVG